jgi:thiosulfate dehydrogenase [quinone] large subunit
MTAQDSAPRAHSATRTHSSTETSSRERLTPLSAVLGVTRLAMGWIFLWPFLDKAFGLGHETARADAWIDGGSPTAGFLGNATSGPFKGMYESFAGQAWADWLFMAGLLGIGLALVLGVAVRLAAAAGVVLMVLMWSAVLPPANNPFLDDHLVYALVLVILALTHAGATFGLAPVWERLGLVRRYPVLR